MFWDLNSSFYSSLYSGWAIVLPKLFSYCLSLDINFKLNYQPLCFLTYACFHEMKGHVFPCCLSSDKISPYISADFHLLPPLDCALQCLRQTVKVMRTLLVGLICGVHCFYTEIQALRERTAREQYPETGRPLWDSNARRGMDWVPC